MKHALATGLAASTLVATGLIASPAGAAPDSTARASSATSTTAAAASTSCKPKADLPSRVEIDRPYKAVKVPFTGLCSSVDYASWYLYGPSGIADVFIYDRSDANQNRPYNTWNVYDWERPGSYGTREPVAYDRNYNSIRAYTDSTSVRYASRAGITLRRRSATVLNVNASSLRYSPSNGRFVRYDTTASIQRLSPGKPWTTVTRVRLGSDGTASVNLIAGPNRQYRVVVNSSSSTWGSTSRTLVG